MKNNTKLNAVFEYNSLPLDDFLMNIKRGFISSIIFSNIMNFQKKVYFLIELYIGSMP